MEPDLQDRLCRQQAFWLRENHDRPIIGFTGTYFATDTIRLLKQTKAPLSPGDIDIEAYLEDCDAQFAAWRDCTGDLFWTASPLPGFYRWLSAAVGQPLLVKSDNIWCEPFLADYSNLGGLAVSEKNEWIEVLWTVTDALVERAAARYPVAVKSFLGPLSTLADLRGDTQLAYDLYDHPNDVERAMGLLTETWVRLASSHFEHLPTWHGGYTSAARYVWAPGRIIEFNEDHAYMFSPQSYQQFVMPSHTELTRHFEYAYIHVHSTQMHTLGHLLELDSLAAIELTPDYGASVVDLIPAIAKIRARKPVIFHGYLSAEDMRQIIEQVPPEGLCLVSRVDTPEEASRLQDASLR
jgi:hypothetical protein